MPFHVQILYILFQNKAQYPLITLQLGHVQNLISLISQSQNFCYELRIPSWYVQN
jgi:hypothetical protein